MNGKGAGWGDVSVKRGEREGRSPRGRQDDRSLHESEGNVEQHRLACWNQARSDPSKVECPSGSYQRAIRSGCSDRRYHDTVTIVHSGRQDASSGPSRTRKASRYL